MDYRKNDEEMSGGILTRLGTNIVGLIVGFLLDWDKIFIKNGSLSPNDSRTKVPLYESICTIRWRVLLEEDDNMLIC